MSNDVILYTQIASLIAYVTTTFGLYRLLVKQKDSVIELLKEKNSFLMEQLTIASSNSPDALSERLVRRIGILSDEIERLSQDQEKNASLIREKEEQIKETRLQADELQDKIERAKELLADAVCPECGSLITERHSYPIYGMIGDREVEADGEYIAYECGYTAQDGHVIHECRKSNK